LENLETAFQNQYDAVLISDENYKNDLEKIITATSLIILIDSFGLKTTLTNFGFECTLEENSLSVFKKIV